MSLGLPSTQDRLRELQEDRLKEADPSWMMLSPREYRAGLSARRRREKLERTALETGIPLPEDRGKYHNFFRFLEQFDRPRNAAHNAVLGLMAGDGDSVLENIQKGWTFEERTHFEDILEHMGMPAGMLRKVAGFSGDMLADPLLIAPGPSVLVKMLKGTKVGAVAAKTMRAAGQNDLLRRTLVRDSGNQALDEMFMQALDLNSYTKFKRVEDAHPIAKDIARVGKAARLKPEKARSIIGRLGEETDLDRVLDTVNIREKGRLANLSVEMVDDLVESSGQFRNPSAIRELLRVRNPETQREIVEVARRVQEWSDEIAQIREAQGLHVPRFEDGLIATAKVIDDELGRFVGQTVRQTRVERVERIRQVQGRIDELRKQGKLRAQAANRLSQQLRKAKSTEEVEEITRKFRDLEAEGLSIKVAQREAQFDFLAERPFEIFDDSRRAIAFLDQIAGDMDPRVLTKIHDAIIADMARTNTAARMYDTMMMRNLVQAMRTGLTGKAAREFTDDLDRINEAVRELPRWMHHLLTPEAEGLILNALKKTKTFRNTFANPRTADVLQRAFVKKVQLNRKYGREVTVPLSFDEVMKALKESGLPETFGKKGKGAKPEDVLHKQRTPLEVLKKQAPELAEFFDTDVATIMASASVQTAKAVSAAGYLQDVSKGFGRTVSDVGESAYQKMYGLDHGPFKAIFGEMEKVVPGVFTKNGQKVRFTREVAEEVARRWDLMMNPQSVIKYFDTMQNWWIGFTLFQFPWYHSRNAVGDTLNMFSGGFGGVAGEKIGEASYATIRGTGILWNVLRNNSGAARRFSVKMGDKNVNGQDFFDIMLRNGVVNSNWSAGVISDEMRTMMQPLELGMRAMNPFSNKWGPTQVGSWVGQWLENSRRAAFFIYKIEEEGMSIRRAAAEVRKHMGDYRSEVMTPFEREYVKRAFPFYRWQRFNIPKQIDDLIRSRASRAKVLGVMRGAQALAPEDIEPTDLPEYVPEWLRASASVPVRRDPETGELSFFVLKNWHPAAEIDNLLSHRAFAKMAVDNLTPFVKAPIEIGTGVDLFRGEKMPEQTEFMGSQLPPELFALFNKLRVLKELDRYDPFGTFRVIRRNVPERQLIGTALGATIGTISPAREQVRLDFQRAEELSKRVSIARRILEKEQLEE